MDKTANQKNINERLIKLIVFIICSLFLIGFFFFPSINLKFENGENEYSLLVTIYELIFGFKKDLISDNNLILSLNINFDLFSLFFFILFILSIILISINFLLKENKKIFGYLAFIFSLLNLIFFLLIPLLYGYFHDFGSIFKEVEVFEAAYIIDFIVLFILLIISSSFLSLKKRLFTTQDIAEMAIMVALALVLDKIKIPVGQSGGSINASLVPLMIFALRRGFIKGLIASSLVFGLLSCVLDGYGIITYPFDYLIAFLGYPFIALFDLMFKKILKEKYLKLEILYLNLSIALGSLFAFIFRMTGSSISSMVLYEYELVPALTYNVLYIGPSILTTLVLMILLSYPILRINKLFPAK